MSSFAVWIDREHVKTFQFSHEKMERKNLQARSQDGLLVEQPEFLELKRRENAFFSEVASHLLDAVRILILGPGITKHHFQNYLLEHRPMMAKKIVGCETVVQATDSEIAKMALRFFKVPVSAQSSDS